MMIPISFEMFAAAIFDMDGTMINNMPYHKKAWIEFCRRYGLTLTEEDFQYRFSGKKNKEILETVFGKVLTDEELAKFTLEKEHLYQEIYAPDIKEVTGLTPLIQNLKKRGLKLGVATTAPETNRNFGLKALDLEGVFDIILGDEHVSKGKPDPQIYLETAKALGIEPQKCIVFEDSPPGVEAGKRAGMSVVGLLTSHKQEELSNADFFVHNFTEVTLE